ncbi:NINE protein [bacterium]|nr:NINE protein [bacterium]
MKSKGVAYLLWFLLGAFSLHRFYLGKIGSGILYLITFQLFGIGWIIDLFILSSMVDNYNLMHGYIGPGKMNQTPNVIVNLTTSPTGNNKDYQ